MKEKLEIFVYHLGYGGIEKAVSSFCYMFQDAYDITIVSLYRLMDQPAFSFPERVSIQYLYDTDLPARMKKYKQAFQKEGFGKFWGLIWKDYFKTGHLLSFLKDFGQSFYLYCLGGRFHKLKKHLKESKASILLSTRYELSELLVKYGNPSSLKIGWEHNHYHDDLVYKKHVVEASKQLNYLVLVSRELTKDYQRELSLAACRPVYIPNVIDQDLDFISDYRNPQIVMVGRLEREKGLFDALEVAKRLQERMVSFHLEIVGDGPLRKDLEKYTMDKNLQEYVTFHGFLPQKEIAKLYAHASLYLMTSFTESFGLVLIEAMNAGLPTIAFSSAEGARELIFNDVNGYLILDRNLDEMATTIETLLKKPDKIRSLGSHAKNYSQNYLPSSVQVMWKQILRR